MSEEVGKYEVEQDEVVSVEEKSISDSIKDKIVEITSCTEEQAEEVTFLFGALVSEAVQFTMNQKEFLQQIFQNMMITQVNANNKLANIEANIEKAEWVVIDEEHPTANLRVHYNGTEAFEWVFETLTDNGWAPLEMNEQQRLHLEVLVGKFFDGRTDRTGYVVDAKRLGE